MKNIENKTAHLKNTLYSNYKAEVFASVMVETGIDQDKIRVIRKGKAFRNVKKEIDSILYEYTDNDAHYTIYTHRRDLYDSLPKGLFHSGASNISDKKRVLKHIEIGRQEEANARLFFKPFELFIDRALIATQLYERRLEKPLSHPDFINLFTHHWFFLKEMPLDKALFVLNFLSQSYRITSSEQIAGILSFFLESKVTIDNTLKTENIESSHKWKLGDAPLGKSSFIGGCFKDTFPVILVFISELPLKFKDLIYVNSPIRKQLLAVLDLFIPADAQLVLNIKGCSQDTAFCLSPEKDTVLGFSTQLQ